MVQYRTIQYVRVQVYTVQDVHAKFLTGEPSRSVRSCNLVFENECKLWILQYRTIQYVRVQLYTGQDKSTLKRGPKPIRPLLQFGL